jgi:hypothetical protein
MRARTWIQISCRSNPGGPNPLSRLLQTASASALATALIQFRRALALEGLGSAYQGRPPVFTGATGNFVRARFPGAVFGTPIESEALKYLEH